MPRGEQMSRLKVHVRGLPEIFYLTSEVAEVLELSPATIRRFGHRDPSLAPGYETWFGRIRVDLYNPATLDRLVEYVDQRCENRGRRRQWDEDTRRARRAAHCSAGYYRRRAAKLSAQGDLPNAHRADRRAQEISAALRNP